MNLLTISSLAELDAFHRRFAENAGRGYDYYQIQWAEVASLYDGIEIAPYQFERRLGYHSEIGKAVSDWYYGWDCASGCIWTPKDTRIEFIEDLVPVPREVEA